MRLAFGVAACCALPALAHAQHSCDDLGGKGWHTVATVETVAKSDSRPYHAASGAWLVDRSITEIPFCHYFNSIGNYSLRSYSLSPATRIEHVEICHDGKAVAPYDGKCPPE